MDIHIERDGQQMGPYTLEQINEYLAQGSLLATDHAWHEGLPQWVALNEIAGVVSNQAATSSPPPFNPSVAAVPEKVGNGSGFLARHKNIIIPVAGVVTIVGSIVVYDLMKTRREQSAVMKAFGRESLERLSKPSYVRFDSRTVEKIVREELKKPHGSIFPADLEKVTNLDLSNLRLSPFDLRGLEKLTQLTTLNLQNNPELTKAQIEQLQKALPNCKITSNPTK